VQEAGIQAVSSKLEVDLQVGVEKVLGVGVGTLFLGLVEVAAG